MIINSPKIGRLTLEDHPFASGGAGEVYRATDTTGGVFCVKKLINIKQGDIDKISFMSKMAAPTYSSGSLCWPIDVVNKRDFKGFVMPMAKTGSIDLLYLTNFTWPISRKKPISSLASKLDRTNIDGIRKRILICCNIASAVEAVHRVGGVIVDLKPQNILVADDGSISLVDLDSIQISNGVTVFRGPLGTPQYMPPESFKINYDNNTVIDKSWDCFSLAVIFYEILLGIHPYTASPKSSIINNGTISDAIRFKMYVHGNKRVDLEVIPQPHEGIKMLPPILHQRFKESFDASDPTKRPTVKEWGESLFEAVKIISQPMSKKTYAVTPTPVPRRRRVSTAGQHSSANTSPFPIRTSSGAYGYSTVTSVSGNINTQQTSRLKLTKPVSVTISPPPIVSSSTNQTQPTNPSNTKDYSDMIGCLFWIGIVFFIFKSCN